MNAFAGAMSLALYLSACSGNEHGVEPIAQSPSPMQNDLRVKGKLSLDWGGALSKQLKSDQKYRQFKVTLTAGTNSVALKSGKDLTPDEFVVGAESSQGKAIMELLNSEQPWKWDGLKAVPFANALYFNGDVEEKTWKCISVYPDPQLEKFLVRLRRALERR